jgi:hypothetical protein
MFKLTYGFIFNVEVGSKDLKREDLEKYNKAKNQAQ